MRHFCFVYKSIKKIPLRFTVSRNENTNPEHFAAAFNPLAGKKFCVHCEQ